MGLHHAVVGTVAAGLKGRTVCSSSLIAVMGWTMARVRRNTERTTTGIFLYGDENYSTFQLLFKTALARGRRPRKSGKPGRDLWMFAPSTLQAVQDFRSHRSCK